MSEEKFMQNEFISDALSLASAADACDCPPAQARNLYMQASRILRAVARDADSLALKWRAIRLAESVEANLAF